MNIIFNLLIVGIAVVWLALVAWAFLDARRRIDDRFLVGCATVGALIPFLGPLVYLIVRPPELLADVRERDIEIAAAKARLESAAAHQCPHCDAPGHRDFLRCPSCLRKLREPCGSCARPVEREWRICPYCEADQNRQLSETAPARARRRKAKPVPAAAVEPVLAVQPDTSASAETSQERPAQRATTKAAAKRSTRRPAAPAGESRLDSASSRASAEPSGASALDAGGSPEPEPSV